MGDERTCEHEWDLAAHGPGGSTFECLRCGAIKESQPAVEPSPVPSGPVGPSEEAAPTSLEIENGARALPANLGDSIQQREHIAEGVLRRAARYRPAASLAGEPSEGRTLPESGYWLYARGVALPPGDSAWGRCENCVALPRPCFSCSLRVELGDPPKDKAGLPGRWVVDSASDAGYAYGEGYKAGLREVERMAPEHSLSEAQEELLALVSVQALDEGLWNAPLTSQEVRQELRRLHEAVEAAFPAEGPGSPSPPREADEVEAVAEAIYVTNLRLAQRRAGVESAIYPYERLIEPTRDELREMARAALDAARGRERGEER